MCSELNLEVSPFGEDPPSELLVWVSEGDTAERNAAAKELVERYKKRVFQVLRRGLGSDVSDAQVGDFVIDAFAKAFSAKASFKGSEGKSIEAEGNAFVKWISIIAENLFKDWFVQEYSHGEFSEELFGDADVACGQASEPQPSNPVILALEEILGTEFTDREADILRTHAQFSPDTNNKQAKMPRKVIDAICNRYNTSRENIRTIRSRAYKKLKKKLQEKGIDY